MPKSEKDKQSILDSVRAYMQEKVEAKKKRLKFPSSALKRRDENLGGVLKTAAALKLYEGKYPTWKALKRYRVPLDPEERKLALERKARWNDGSMGIKKAKFPDGKTWYYCNTHRAGAVRPTLKGALSKWPFIKSTA
jgi:hypothetical protein